VAKKRESVGYELRVKNDNNHLSFDLIVKGDDGGKPYTLSVDTANNQPGLVGEAFRVLGTLWPAFAFRFEGNAAREITDIYVK
jgi:hypothetical protein